MGTKMAVAFSVIFIHHLEKQLLLSSAHKYIIGKRFTADISQCGLQANKKVNPKLTFDASSRATGSSGSLSGNSSSDDGNISDLSGAETDGLMLLFL